MSTVDGDVRVLLLETDVRPAVGAGDDVGALQMLPRVPVAVQVLHEALRHQAVRTVDVRRALCLHASDMEEPHERRCSRSLGR